MDIDQLWALLVSLEDSSPVVEAWLSSLLVAR